MCLLGISQYSQFPMTAQKLWFLGCPPRLYFIQNDSEIFWISINLWHTQYITVHHSAQCLMICAGSRRPTRPSISFRTVEVRRTLEVSSMKIGGRLKGKSGYNREVHMDFHGFPTWNISRFPMVSCFFQPFQWHYDGISWESSLIHSMNFHGVPGRRPPDHVLPGVNPVPVPDLFTPVVKGPIRARSADGLEMLISISFQWRLKPRAQECWDMLR